MFDKAFNLLDEPWIRVVRPDAAEEEVSLTDALLGAHAYADLAGELPTQDVAVLRLLLAVLHTVFSRVDCRGQEAPLTSTSGALRRWSELWRLGHFPEEPLRAYLAAWHERFWLFHPERPFYQVNEAAIGTPSGACKLNGEISQSGNKERLFSVRSGAQKERLSYAEATRWLLYVNGFDDKSLKPKTGKNDDDAKEKHSEEGKSSADFGWLGKLGLITAVGRNLFETLMLNLVLLPDRKPWPEPEQPCWELERPRTGERVCVAMPRNAAGLLTLQSRRILLQREGDAVTKYRVLVGDQFPEEDALFEQMTIWTEKLDKQKNHLYYKPKRNDIPRQMWRDFAAIAAKGEGRIQPGVVNWVPYLRRATKCEGLEWVTFRTVSVKYGNQDSCVDNIFQDSLTFHAELLQEIGSIGYSMVESEICQIDRAAKCIGTLVYELFLASGWIGDSRTKQKRGRIRKNRSIEQFYDIVDAPFRQWMASLNPEDGYDTLLMRQVEWRRMMRSMLMEMKTRLVEEAGNRAFIGRKVKEKNEIESKEMTLYCAPKAVNHFMRAINKLFPLNQETGE